MITVSTIAAAITAAREGALPGRSVAEINEVLRTAGADIRRVPLDRRPPRPRVRRQVPRVVRIR